METHGYIGSPKKIIVLLGVHASRDSVYNWHSYKLIIVYLHIKLK
mgnify:CR=1 FL=1